MATITLLDNTTSAEIRKKTAKPLIWIAIVSIIMLFSGWTSAVIVSKGGNGNWLNIDLPSAFTLSTILIILSSLSFQYGLISIRKDNKKILKLTTGLTFMLGLMFVVSQFYGWKELTEKGIYATGSGSTNASSFVYLITAVHVLHLLAGLISLMVVFVKSINEKYNATNFLGVEVSIIYWHFLGALWVYLFLFLKFIA